jgi:hypothetical protein
MSDLQIKDDYNLQEAWNRVCGSFANTTGGIDLTKAPKYTPDEVLEQIRSKQDDDDEKNAKYRVAKEVIGKTLYCINILGNIAAQGASMVSVRVVILGQANLTIQGLWAKYPMFQCCFISH